jgi:sRNA-binding protein
MKRLTYGEYQEAIAVLLQLRGAFPEVIARLDLYQRRPLKIGIDRDVRDLLPEVDPVIIGRAMRVYCGDRRYLAAMIAGAPRVDLDGVVCGAVTAEEAVGARNGIESILRRSEARAAAKAIGKLSNAQVAVGETTGRPGKLGLAGLKAAARARAGADASTPT